MSSGVHIGIVPKQKRTVGGNSVSGDLRHLGRILERERRRAGVKVVDLQQRTGLSRQTILEIESGNHVTSMRIDTLYRYCAGIPVDPLAAQREAMILAIG